ncbi:MAG: tRNA (adenosine(37)-N6)-threonylcarbamoyltransferase complex ATPase subunit type 1 TsaE [Desulfuromonadales bacterium]|nr:tRNA (adenosine(37)-N6)-threonylcarbamoyltransferase complex ATPase subunit type 1 TsaE [Desulfuromonadales bacterium]
MSDWSIASVSPEQTRQIGVRLGELALPGLTVLLSGPLGAGKTCFAQGVAAGLGVPAHLPVTSPSYSLMNIHTGRMPLYHFDLYRLSRIDDLGDLGYDEYADGDGLTLVEWADRVGAGLAASLEIRIERTGENERRLHFQALNGVGQKLLAQLVDGSPRI